MRVVYEGDIEEWKDVKKDGSEVKRKKKKYQSLFDTAW